METQNKRVHPLTEDEDYALTRAIQQLHARAVSLVNAGVDSYSEWEQMQTLELLRKRLTVRPEGE